MRHTLQCISTSLCTNSVSLRSSFLLLLPSEQIIDVGPGGLVWFLCFHDRGEGERDIKPLVFRNTTFSEHARTRDFRFADAVCIRDEFLNKTILYMQ